MHESETDPAELIRPLAPGEADSVLFRLLTQLGGNRPAARPPAPLADWTQGWGRPGDSGMVALLGDTIAGAAWMRLPTPTWQPVAFVAADIPMLACAVLPAHQGAGLGTALVTGVLNVAQEAEHPAVAAASPEIDQLEVFFARCGFRIVGRAGAEDIYLADLL